LDGNRSLDARLVPLLGGLAHAGSELKERKLIAGTQNDVRHAEQKAFVWTSRVFAGHFLHIS
jgi:hypothetical protein